MYNNNIIQGFHIKYNMTEIDKDYRGLQNSRKTFQK